MVRVETVDVRGTLLAICAIGSRRVGARSLTMLGFAKTSADQGFP